MPVVSIVTNSTLSLEVKVTVSKAITSAAATILKNIAVGDQIMVFSGLRAGLVSDSTPNVRRSMS
ncbi:hypothetical protein HaLaN_29493 [Haematococcus lacustris]|uniref:Uncharacterized protein n=1 Tax=Haematococcus lacustris TaxID=44745 RepID=A0A6A0AD53_HAELA|nr:hypothetical protein HaLaN_29493 [Haematococcus lacustris]